MSSHLVTSPVAESNNTNSNNSGGGGGFSWKSLQPVAGLLLSTLNPSPPVRTKESLPAPPPGMEWVQNTTTKDWRLIKATTTTTTTASTSESDLALEKKQVTDTTTAPTTTTTNVKTVAVPVSPDDTQRKKSLMEQEQNSTKAVDDVPPLILPPRCSSIAIATSSNTTSTTSVVDRLPNVHIQQRQTSTGTINNNNNDNMNEIGEEGWEVLSDRISSSSNQTPSVIIHPYYRSSPTQNSGSVRSLSSMENGGNNNNSTNNLNAIFDRNTTLNIPFKIQRTASSSTIDSSDNALGPLGKGILGVDYLEHVVLPTDTLQGICISYKITSTQLRQANCFSGNSLLLAPSKLVIPLSKKALRSGFIRVQDTDQKEYKLHAMLAEFPDLSMTEAKAYLELSDWILKDAIRSAKEDLEWERDNDDNIDNDECGTFMNAATSSTATTTATSGSVSDHTTTRNNSKMNRFFRAGEIRITPRLGMNGIAIGFDTKGAGIHKSILNPSHCSSPKATKQSTTAGATTTKATNDTTISSSSSLRGNDIYSQHNNFGVELQDIPSLSSSTSATVLTKK